MKTKAGLGVPSLVPRPTSQVKLAWERVHVCVHGVFVLFSSYFIFGFQRLLVTGYIGQGSTWLSMESFHLFTMPMGNRYSEHAH